jgi:hypothetical protein
MLEVPVEPHLLQQNNKMKVSLMWDILEYAAGRPDHRGKGLVQPSFYNDQEVRKPTGNFSVDDRDIESLSDNIHTTNDQTAVSPNQLLPSGHASFLGVGNYPDEEIFQQQTTFFDTDINTHPSWLGWTRSSEDIQGTHDSDLTFHEQTAVSSDWWTSGVL